MLQTVIDCSQCHLEIPKPVPRLCRVGVVQLPAYSIEGKKPNHLALLPEPRGESSSPKVEGARVRT
jgi:hypothetical protein